MEMVEGAEPRAVPEPGNFCYDIVATCSGYRSLCNKPPRDLRRKITTAIILQRNLQLGQGLVGISRLCLTSWRGDSTKAGLGSSEGFSTHRSAGGCWLLAEHQAGPSAGTPTHGLSTWPGLPHNTVAVGQGQASLERESGGSHIVFLPWGWKSSSPTSATFYSSRW